LTNTAKQLLSNPWKRNGEQNGRLSSGNSSSKKRMSLSHSIEPAQISHKKGGGLGFKGENGGALLMDDRKRNVSRGRGDIKRGGESRAQKTVLEER